MSDTVASRLAGLTVFDAEGWNFVKGLRAFAKGFRQGARRGNPVQQGCLFVLGPGDRVRSEWRDRFAGDHAPMPDVVAALG